MFIRNPLLALCFLTVIAPLHAQWIKTSGPQGVYSLVSGDDGGSSGISSATVMAGTDNGIYRSLDAGTTWDAANTGMASFTVRALVATNAGRRDSNGLFAGTAGGGVFRSTNGGSSWFSVNSGLTSLVIHSLSFSAAAGALYAGTDGGVFRTTNNGNSWEPLNNGLPNAAIRTIAVDGSMLHAGTEGQGVFSAIGSTTWVAANTGLTSLNMRYILQYLLVAATDSGIFKSTNGGETWIAINNGLANRSVRVLFRAPGIFADPVVAGTDGGIFFADILFYEPQGPVNWAAYNEGLADPNVRALALAYAGGGGYLFAGTNSGVWRRPSSQIIPNYVDGIKGPGTKFHVEAAGAITFNLPLPSIVSLRAFSLAGKELLVLLDKRFSTGTHRVDLKKIDLPSGVYLFRLRTGSTAVTQKVLLSR